MQVVVLCGGKGTRLGELTANRPKYLVPVLGKPFCDWQIELLCDQGFTDFLFCIGHLGSQIRSHVEYHHHDLAAEFFSDDVEGKWHAYLHAGRAGLLRAQHAVVYGDVYVPLSNEEVPAPPFVLSSYDGLIEDAGLRFMCWPRRPVREHVRLTRPHFEVGSVEGIAALEAYLS